MSGEYTSCFCFCLREERHGERDANFNIKEFKNK